MGRLLITNNNNWYKNLNKTFTDSGFKENVCLKQNNVIINTYSKINFETENFYQENNDFVFCAGTLIYKEKIGSEALKEIFIDSKTSNITTLRKSLIGCFVLAIKQGDKISVTVDESGIYAFYYYNENTDFLMTDTYWHIANETKQPVNRLALIESEFNFCILNNESPFMNIYRIQRDEEFVIDSVANKIEIRKIELNRYQLKGTTIDEVAVYINKKALEVFSIARPIINNPILFATGGVDSRLILANYIKSGILPKLGSWYNSHISMNTKDDDKVCVNEIAQKVNLPFVSFNMNEKDEEILNDVDKYLLNRLGEHAFIYNGNQNWHKILFENNVGFADYGYFGETLKGWVALDCYTENSKVDLDSYLDIYLKRASKELEKSINNYSVFYDYVKRKFEIIADEECLNKNSLSREDMMRLYCRYRLHADTVVYQYANLYTYAFPVYAQKELVDYINDIPYEYKLHEKLNLMMQKKLESKLLEVTFFTHCHFAIFDSEKLELHSSDKKTLKQKFRIILSKTKIGNKIIGIYKRFKPKTVTSDNLLQGIKNTLINSKVFNQLSLDKENILSLHLPSLIHFVKTCKAIDNEF